MKMFGFGLPELLLAIATLITFALLAFIPAYIAWKKDYSFGGFWLFGFFLFLPALIVALLMSDKTQVTVGSADEIAKYKTLLDNETITREEFEKKKSELLA